MSTTNDPQAPYGEKPEQREPLLSDKQMGATTGDSWGWDCAAEVRDFYEDLITKGDLITRAQLEEAIAQRDDYWRDQMREMDELRD